MATENLTKLCAADEDDRTIRKNKSRKSRRVSFAETYKVSEFVANVIDDNPEISDGLNGPRKEDYTAPTYAGMQNLFTAPIKADFTNDQASQRRVLCLTSQTDVPMPNESELSSLDTTGISVNQSSHSGHASTSLSDQTSNSIYVPQRTFSPKKGFYNLTEQDDYATVMNTCINKHAGTVVETISISTASTAAVNHPKLPGERVMASSGCEPDRRGSSASGNQTLGSSTYAGWEDETTRVHSGSRMEMTRCFGDDKRRSSIMADKTRMFDTDNMMDQTNVVSALSTSVCVPSEKTICFQDITMGDNMEFTLMDTPTEKLNTFSIRKSLISKPITDNSPHEEHLPIPSASTNQSVNPDPLLDSPVDAADDGNQATKADAISFLSKLAGPNWVPESPSVSTPVGKNISELTRISGRLNLETTPASQSHARSFLSKIAGEMNLDISVTSDEVPRASNKRKSMSNRTIIFQDLDDSVGMDLTNAIQPASTDSVSAVDVAEFDKTIVFKDLDKSCAMDMTTAVNRTLADLTSPNHSVAQSPPDRTVHFKDFNKSTLMDMTEVAPVGILRPSHVSSADDYHMDMAGEHRQPTTANQTRLFDEGDISMRMDVTEAATGKILMKTLHPIASVATEAGVQPAPSVHDADQKRFSEETDKSMRMDLTGNVSRPLLNSEPLYQSVETDKLSQHYICKHRPDKTSYFEDNDMSMRMDFTEVVTGSISMKPQQPVPNVAAEAGMKRTKVVPDANQTRFWEGTDKSMMDLTGIVTLPLMSIEASEVEYQQCTASYERHAGKSQHTARSLHPDQTSSSGHNDMSMKMDFTEVATAKISMPPSLECSDGRLHQDNIQQVPGKFPKDTTYSSRADSSDCKRDTEYKTGNSTLPNNTQVFSASDKSVLMTDKATGGVDPGLSMPTKFDFGNSPENALPGKYLSHLENSKSSMEGSISVKRIADTVSVDDKPSGAGSAKSEAFVSDDRSLPQMDKQSNISSVSSNVTCTYDTKRPLSDAILKVKGQQSSDREMLVQADETTGKSFRELSNGQQGNKSIQNSNLSYRVPSKVLTADETEAQNVHVCSATLDERGDNILLTDDKENWTRSADRLSGAGIMQEKSPDFSRHDLSSFSLSTSSLVSDPPSRLSVPDTGKASTDQSMTAKQSINESAFSTAGILQEKSPDFSNSTQWLSMSSSVMSHKVLPCNMSALDDNIHSSPPPKKLCLQASQQSGLPRKQTSLSLGDSMSVKVKGMGSFKMDADGLEACDDTICHLPAGPTSPVTDQSSHSVPSNTTHALDDPHSLPEIPTHSVSVKSSHSVSDFSINPLSDKSIYSVSDKSIHSVSDKSIHSVSDKSIHSVSDKSIHSVSDKSIHSVSDKSMYSTSDKSIHSDKFLNSLLMLEPSAAAALDVDVGPGESREQVQRENGGSSLAEILSQCGVLLRSRSKKRRSTMGATDVRPAESVSDMLRLPLQQTEKEITEWANNFMEETIPNVQHRIQELEDALMANLPERLQADPCTEKERKGLRQLQSQCSKASRASFKQWKAKILKSQAESSEADEDLLIQIQEKLERSDGLLTTLKARLLKDSEALDSVIADLNAEKTKHEEAAEAETRLVQEEACLAEERVRTESGIYHDMKIRHNEAVEELTSIREEEVTCSQDLAQLQLNLSKVEAFQLLKPFSVEYWKQQGACLSLLRGSLLVKMGFEPSAGNSSGDEMTVHRVVRVHTEPGKDGGADQLMRLSNKLLQQAIDGMKLQSLCPITTTQLFQHLRKVGLLNASASKFVRDMRQVGLKHELCIRENTLEVVFSSLKAHCKFTLTFNLENQLRSEKLVWSFNRVIGTIRQSEIEQVIQEHPASFENLACCLKAIHDYLHQRKIDIDITSSASLQQYYATVNS